MLHERIVSGHINAYVAGEVDSCHQSTLKNQAMIKHSNKIFYNNLGWAKVIFLMSVISKNFICFIPIIYVYMYICMYLSYIICHQSII